jgi:hypothetical protein
MFLLRAIQGLQPDDQLQVIENVLLDCDGLCCIRSKMLSFKQNGPRSQTVYPTCSAA